MPDACEANALNILYAQTTVPVPRVHRVIPLGPTHVIALEYIEGDLLSNVWSTYSLWRKIYIGFTLRRYIRQIRRTCKAPPSAPPGPVITEGTPARMCYAPSVFSHISGVRGPFSTYADLADFFNARRDMSTSPDDPYRKVPFDDSEALVLSHLDLNLRNMIVDKDGRLWIIDWAWSGYYPPWFEYLATLSQSSLARVCGTDDHTWKHLIPFICGPYFKQWDWHFKAAPALNQLS